VSAAAEELFPALTSPSASGAIRYGGTTLDYPDIAAAAGGVAERLDGASVVAVLATPSSGTLIGVVGALAAGAAVVLINPGSAAREIEYVLADSAPEAVIASHSADLPGPLASSPRVSPEGAAGKYRERFADDPERTALIIYTSGTTGPPKGVQIPRRAISSNLDAVAEAWGWTSEDMLAHALPLFHVHGLVLGTLGPLRVGGSVEHFGRFSPEAAATALDAGATMFFGVPTMYRRLADAAQKDGAIATSLIRARILVSGSASLPAFEHKRVMQLTGQQIIERYGMTETLMNTSTRLDGERRAGSVGRSLGNVELRLLDDDGTPLRADDKQIGEISVRGPNVFTGYLNQPDATAVAFRDGWFLTGDLATQDTDGFITIVGRRSTDLIKSGGFKIGAGEVESVLLEHEAVAEVAVTGEVDADLGERVIAWVVLAKGARVSTSELISHTEGGLAAYKRPREIRLLAELPRNAMGKILKKDLTIADQVQDE
jgi:malonyl-CoA/methylmalonyl-CoA synthetase